MVRSTMSLHGDKAGRVKIPVLRPKELEIQARLRIVRGGLFRGMERRSAWQTT